VPDIVEGAALSAPITPDEIRVVDGDTIRLHQQRPDVRLVGFNAPETRRALCDAERELTPSCNYGRRCGILKADGRDVAAILISENLAVPFVCGQDVPPTPKPWCK